MPILLPTANPCPYRPATLAADQRRRVPTRLQQRTTLFLSSQRQRRHEHQSSGSSARLLRRALGPAVPRLNAQWCCTTQRLRLVQTRSSLRPCLAERQTQRPRSTMGRPSRRRRPGRAMQCASGGVHALRHELTLLLERRLRRQSRTSQLRLCAVHALRHEPRLLPRPRLQWHRRASRLHLCLLVPQVMSLQRAASGGQALRRSQSLLQRRMVLARPMFPSHDPSAQLSKLRGVFRRIAHPHHRRRGHGGKQRCHRASQMHCRPTVRSRQA